MRRLQRLFDYDKTLRDEHFVRDFLARGESNHKLMRN